MNALVSHLSIRPLLEATATPEQIKVVKARLAKDLSNAEYIDEYELDWSTAEHLFKIRMEINALTAAAANSKTQQVISVLGRKWNIIDSDILSSRTSG